jgi:hypothetical protein
VIDTGHHKLSIGSVSGASANDCYPAGPVGSTGLASGRFRRISPVAAHSGDRLLSEPTAAQPSLRVPLFMCRVSDTGPLMKTRSRSRTPPRHCGGNTGSRGLRPGADAAPRGRTRGRGGAPVGRRPATRRGYRGVRNSSRGCRLVGAFPSCAAKSTQYSLTARCHWH